MVYVSGQPMKRRIAPTAAIAPTRRQVSRVSIAAISVRISAATAVTSALRRELVEIDPAGVVLGSRGDPGRDCIDLRRRKVGRAQRAGDGVCIKHQRNVPGNPATRPL